MTNTLAAQINDITENLQNEMLDSEVLRLVSYGSHFVGNTLAINIAMKIGFPDNKIVLVDLIPSNTSLRTTLEIKPQYFIEDYLESSDKDSYINEMIVRTKLPNVSIISTQRSYADISELNRLLLVLSKEFDQVILNESYSSKREHDLNELKAKNYSILAVDQKRVKKLRFIKFLNSINFQFNGHILVN